MKTTEIEKELLKRNDDFFKKKTDEIMGIFEELDKVSGANNSWVHVPDATIKDISQDTDMSNFSAYLGSRAKFRSFILESIRRTYKEELLKVKTKSLLDKLDVFD